MDFIRREKCMRILDHYGAENQRKQLTEECAELIQAVCKYDRVTNGNNGAAGLIPAVLNARNNIAQEIADVLIMIEQLEIALFGYDRTPVEDAIDFKLNRQIDRIRKEQSCS